MAEVDELLFGDLLDLLTYWKDNPPVHVAVAGLLKSFSSTAKGAASPASVDDVRSFVDQFKA